MRGVSNCCNAQVTTKTEVKVKAEKGAIIEDEITYTICKKCGKKCTADSYHNRPK